MRDELHRTLQLGVADGFLGKQQFRWGLQSRMGLQFWFWPQFAAILGWVKSSNQRLLLICLFWNHRRSVLRRSLQGFTSTQMISQGNLKHWAIHHLGQSQADQSSIACCRNWNPKQPRYIDFFAYKLYRHIISYNDIHIDIYIDRLSKGRLGPKSSWNTFAFTKLFGS
jgi:hypothetical protein